MASGLLFVGHIHAVTQQLVTKGTGTVQETILCSASQVKLGHFSLTGHNSFSELPVCHLVVLISLRRLVKVPEDCLVSGDGGHGWI